MTRHGEPPETVGERLRQTLKEKGLSQAELARRLAGPDQDPNRIANIRRQVVDWAGDKKAPDETSARRIAKALDQPEDTFVTIRRTPVEAASAELRKTTRALEETAESLTSLLAELLPLLRQQGEIVGQLNQLVAELRRREAAKEAEGDSH